jgi:hypothetical protein
VQKPNIREQSKKFVLGDNQGNLALIRVKHRPKRKTKNGFHSARYFLRCGCCNGQLEICYIDGSLEINGVDGSIQNWREILLPLLGINPKTMLTKEQEKAQRLLKSTRKKYARP